MFKYIITSANKAKVIPASQQVNRIGKYLYKGLDGAFKMKTSSNTCDVYVTMLYQLPNNVGDVHEMTLDLNITTYQNKIRVNILEMTPDERTIGFDCYPPEDMMDLHFGKELIMERVKYRIMKAYRDYIFVF